MAGSEKNKEGGSIFDTNKDKNYPTRKTIYPAIDIREGRVVRLLQGSYDKEIIYKEDPLLTAKEFLEKGSRWLHIVDLDAAKTGRPENIDLIKRLTKNLSQLKIQLGGGIRSEDTIKAYLEAGIKRLVIGTKAIEDWQWFCRIAQKDEYTGKIALGLDARSGKLATRGWQVQTDISIREFIRKVSDLKLAAIIYTDIGRDGMLSGPDISGLKELSSSTDIPIIASGGISSIEDIKRLLRIPIEGIIIGRAIYEGKIDLAEAIAVAEQIAS